MLMIIILIYYNYCSVWKRSLEPSIMLIGTFFFCCCCCSSSEKKMGFSTIVCSFVLLSLFVFLSFIPSHWKRKKRITILFFLLCFCFNSLSKSGLLGWTEHCTHTLGEEREERERESARGGQTDTRTRQVKELWYSARIFPKWLDHHYQKTRHNNTKKQRNV